MGFWGQARLWATQRILVKNEDNKRILGRDSDICGKTMELRERSKEIFGENENFKIKKKG